MKVMLLGDANSSHILKWVSGLKSKGVELALYSLTPLLEDNAHYYTDVSIGYFDKNISSGRLAEKTRYLKALPKMKALHKAFQPDIVHAHYASSYGLLGALCGFPNYMISVWGTDVYVSPKANPLNGKMLKYSLSKADVVFSTSEDMARETRLYTQKDIQVIPFGVNLSDFVFNPHKFNGEEIFFATAKSLKPVYNIPLTIKVFKSLHKRYPNIKLFVAGDGPQKEVCRAEAGNAIGESVFFEGSILHKDMPQFLSDKHVLLNIPESESFGVSVLEASASGMAVVASNRGGLPEVVLKDQTGMLIDAPFEQNLTEAMEKMILLKTALPQMGEKGRAFVEQKYAWKVSVEKQYQAYVDFLNR